MIFKWNEENVGTTWTPSSLAYSTFLCHRLLPSHRLLSTFHVLFLPCALVTAPFKVHPLKFGRRGRAVILKCLALAYCTFVSERQGAFLNGDVSSLFYFETDKTLSLRFALIRVLFHPTPFSVLAYFSQNGRRLVLVRWNKMCVSYLQMVRPPQVPSWLRCLHLMLLPRLSSFAL